MFEYCTVVRLLSRKGQAVPLFRAYIGGTSFLLLNFGFSELKITFGTSSSCYTCRTRSPQRLVIPFSVHELQLVLFPSILKLKQVRFIMYKVSFIIPVHLVYYF